MHEERKLAEARYFLARMRQAELISDEQVYRFEISAFLSAARSVLQYACEEARARGAQPWYQQAVESNECIRVLKDERDSNIHSKPAVLGTMVSQTLGPVVDGIEYPSRKTRWFFGDWRGAENATQLAERYVEALEVIVADGRSRGILSV
jgi:hypothetical protein